MKPNQFFVALFISVQCIVAQTPEISSEIKDHIKSRVDQKFNPSISLAYIEGDEVAYYNYGMTAAQNGEAVDQNTVYEIGSISKVFTTIVLADEVLKGNMKLTDPASKYLPESVTMPQRNGKVITLKDLATHTSALPRMPGNFSPADINNPFADYTVVQLYEFLSGYELTRDIGSQYEYSNLGMGLLGHILELHTGKSYEALIKERITGPLKMDNTAIAFTDNMKKHLAIGHNDQSEAVSNWDIITLAGAGGIRSTASDMVKFIMANTSKGDSSLHKAMRLSHEIAYSNESQDFNIGLGWHFANSDTIVWHNGGTGGYRAFSGFLSGTNRGVVVLTNSTFGVDNIGLRLLDAPVGLQMPTRQEFPDVVEVSNEVLDTYIGNYQLAPQFFIAITREDNQLYAQATGQSRFEIYPSAENEFFLRVVEASITFNKDDSGKVTSLTLHQGGQNVPGPKVE